MNTIYYFTGTGNTLFAAKKFAEHFPGETELIPIANLDRSGEIDPWTSDTVGFFFPVYCFGIPHIFTTFLDRVKSWEKTSGRKKPYVYSLCTSGGMKGTAAMILDDILYGKGLRLDGAFHVQMPSNYIPLSTPPTTKRCEKMYRQAEEDIQKFVKFVEQRKRERPVRVFPFDLFGELVAKRAVACMMESYDKYFWLNEDCDGCGLCQKICPASNIIMMNGMPTWRGHCEQCMACLQWCPKQAIQFKRMTMKRKRYHHPDITPEELFRDVK
ncbi:MAG: EFR1 family ferrodoxin [Lentisphaeria bacterium]|nr:EFR1 family ferrodoxin [Lentisphaeria bacterium]